MEQKINQLSSEEQLLQARELGLNEAVNVNSMSAHGKVLSMDTFSWVNPNNDTLATVLSSFPFPVIWIGNHDQIKSVLENYPSTVDNIKTIVIQNKSTLKLDRKTLDKFSNILCIDGAEFALKTIQSFAIEKHVFLYTCGGQNAQEQKKCFTEFIKNL